MTGTHSQTATTDVTIRNDVGEVLLFSWNDFVTNICEGTACFVCGRSRGEVNFNDERIVPNWVLRVCDLHRKQITIPNGNPIIYGSYTVPTPLTQPEAARLRTDRTA